MLFKILTSVILFVLFKGLLMILVTSVFKNKLKSKLGPTELMYLDLSRFINFQ